MSFIRVFQVVSLFIGIIAFVTGKSYIGDVDGNDMGNVFVFIFDILWAGIKLGMTYVVLAVSLALSIPALILSFFIDSNPLFSMWNWSWGEVAVDWFWNGTEGISLFFAFLISSTIGFFVEDSQSLK